MLLSDGTLAWQEVSLGSILSTLKQANKTKIITVLPLFLIIYTILKIIKQGAL